MLPPRWPPACLASLAAGCWPWDGRGAGVRGAARTPARPPARTRAPGSGPRRTPGPARTRGSPPVRELARGGTFAMETGVVDAMMRGAVAADTNGLHPRTVQKAGTVVQGGPRRTGAPLGRPEPGDPAGRRLARAGRTRQRSAKRPAWQGRPVRMGPGLSGRARVLPPRPARSRQLGTRLRRQPQQRAPALGRAALRPRLLAPRAPWRPPR
mmetsp:Transcript_66755/g.215125  ORF Transcript_66755/g.215125 Transcript_66755/m.215125 type:complete len:211 (-) Transcript_66755:1256-1888(-)